MPDRSTKRANSGERCTCPPPTPPFDAVIDITCPVHGPGVGAIVTEAMEDDRLIAALEPDACELCGKKAELRPYGPNGERVCFQCGMKDEKAMKRQFEKRFQ